MAINEEILSSLKEINGLMDDSPFSEEFFRKLLESTENKSNDRRVDIIRDLVNNLADEV